MTDAPAATAPTTDPAAGAPRRRIALRALAVVGAAGFAAFWVWALFFASTTPVNRIEDREWAARAETICAEADQRRLALADFREMREATPELVRERADIIDAATDIIERMLDDVVGVAPVGTVGVEAVPMWEADYRTYLDNRRDYADELRSTGINSAFFESEASGIPISERLETWAADNKMASCAPPRDLTR